MMKQIACDDIFHSQSKNSKYIMLFLQNVPQDVPQDSLNSQIISMIKDNNKISTETIASVLGTSSKTIKRHIKSMPNIHYVGRGSNGHWEIKE